VPGELPSGIVTFVFTDIEGSTRLFRRIGDRYPPLLERHHQILREAWRTHGGCEVKTEGDAFFVAFADTGDALAACAHAQRALAAEAWPSDAVLRVRMGVHAGLGYPRDGDYIAFAVHQAARVVNAANGGQVVVSAEAASRVTPAAGVGLVSMGRYRVRDFDEPVELFLVDAAGVAMAETALRVLPADCHNLARPLTGLIGRDSELDELAELLREHRLLSVVGAGGLGKTRLVIEYGLAHAQEWEHGAWFVDLARISDPAGLAGLVAEAVGAPIERDREVWPAVIDHLRDRETAVLMDNCEHLGGEVTVRVDSLLRACPRVRVLATSREPLGLRGERVWRPTPLAADTSGLELFCQRAGLGDMDAATRASAVELCARLDGLPLAIELAAARADVVTPAQILARLDTDRGLGASRDPTLDPRQRSLEDLIGWSYDLLDEAEQAAFRRLGLFVAGFDLSTVTAAVADESLDEFDVADLVWSLLAKSLIITDPTGEGTRYRMLATIRSHARQVLDSHHELADVAARLARHYLDEFGPDVSTNDSSFYADLARELDNLRHLIPIAAGFQQQTAQELATVVVGEVARASPRQSLVAGLALLEELDRPRAERVGLLARTADSAVRCGDIAAADHRLDQAAALRATTGEPPWLDGMIDQQRGLSAVHRRDLASAREIAASGLARATTPIGKARLYNLQSLTCAEAGDFHAAKVAVERTMECTRSVHSNMMNLSNLAELSLRIGDLREAAGHQHESLDLAARIGDATVIAFSANVAARIMGNHHEWALATRLQAAADAILADAGVVLYPSDRELNDTLLASAAEHLGPDEFEQERLVGSTLPIEDTIAETTQVLAALAARDN
jgi:predicted ATPase/class 3 adenylate cyclase